MSFTFPHPWERDSFREYRTDRQEICGLVTRERRCREPMVVRTMANGTVTARCPVCDSA